MLISVMAMLMAAGTPTAAEPATVSASGAAPAASGQPDEVDQLLQQTVSDVRAGHNAEALVYLDPMAGAVTNRISREKDPTYCAHSSAEAKIYLARATPASPTVHLVQPRLCMVLFLRAYALENLHRLPEAIEQLRQLIVLEPEFPHFQVEYGAALRQAGNMVGALTAYRRAVEIAAPVKDYAPDQAAALRGIGMVLTEQGDLDGAEKAYHESLALMPGHPVALHELAYIAHLRATGTKAPQQTVESSTNPAILPVPGKMQSQ
jgi:Flp pilus assembly protein TadD